MNDENDYVSRLEKIIDKQDGLLSQFDAKFNQQDTLNEYLSKHNELLKEDIQKHKNLLKDMNKAVNQHKNVVKNLKKELEEQLKIQQTLHKDYGEVIKELTDELEEEKAKSEDLEKTITNLKKEILDLKKQIPQKSAISQSSSQQISYMDTFNKNDSYSQKSEDAAKTCPECGADVSEGYLFCESCGTKLK